MRLIDADELKKELREFLVNDNHVINPSTTYLDVLDVVEEQSIAYDIDKVVEELNNERNKHREIRNGMIVYEDTARFSALSKAIEIVERGGKE